jgi:4-hydroxythreonine-4-phosphate dehydrogenase
MAQEGIVGAIVKGPSNKESLKLGGNPHDTELPLVAEWLGETEYGEVNVVGDLFTTRVTSHVPLKNVASLLSPKKILKTVQLMHRVLVQAGHKNPKIGISGLNPHAGEHGLFGDEEGEIIEPGIAMARELGIDVEGPLPPDTIFVRARRGDFPGVVTMYHDQGLIAMKLLGFDQGVSVSGGLSIPIMTTSHGTAYDIAGKGTADPGAFQAAVRLATQMAQN